MVGRGKRTKSWTDSISMEVHSGAPLAQSSPITTAPHVHRFTAMRILPSKPFTLKNKSF